MLLRTEPETPSLPPHFAISRRLNNSAIASMLLLASSDLQQPTPSCSIRCASPAHPSCRAFIIGGTGAGMHGPGHVSSPQNRTATTGTKMMYPTHTSPHVRMEKLTLPWSQRREKEGLRRGRLSFVSGVGSLFDFGDFLDCTALFASVFGKFFLSSFQRGDRRSFGYISWFLRMQ